MDQGFRNDSANGTESDQLTERLIEGCLLVLICLLAMGGNLVLWVVMARSRELHTVSNVLLLSLSAADLLVAVVNMPLTAYTVFVGRWEFSETTCVITGFTNMFFLVASVMSLCMITLNRYVRVCQPGRYHTCYSRRAAALHILGVWCLSAVLSVPPLLGWGEYRYLPTQYLCYCRWQASLSYSIFMVAFCFGGTSSLMTVCYVAIYRTFTRSKRQLRWATKGVGTAGVTREPGTMGTMASTLFSDFRTVHDRLASVKEWQCGQERSSSERKQGYSCGDQELPRGTLNLFGHLKPVSPVAEFNIHQSDNRLQSGGGSEPLSSFETENLQFEMGNLCSYTGEPVRAYTDVNYVPERLDPVGNSLIISTLGTYDPDLECESRECTFTDRYESEKLETRSASGKHLFHHTPVGKKNDEESSSVITTTKCDKTRQRSSSNKTDTNNTVGLSPSSGTIAREASQMPADDRRTNGRTETKFAQLKPTGKVMSVRGREERGLNDSGSLKDGKHVCTACRQTTVTEEIRQPRIARQVTETCHREDIQSDDRHDRLSDCSRDQKGTRNHNFCPLSPVGNKAKSPSDHTYSSSGTINTSTYEQTAGREVRKQNRFSRFSPRASHTIGYILFTVRRRFGIKPSASNSASSMEGTGAESPYQTERTRRGYIKSTSYPDPSSEWLENDAIVEGSEVHRSCKECIFDDQTKNCLGFASDLSCEKYDRPQASQCMTADSSKWGRFSAFHGNNPTDVETVPIAVSSCSGTPEHLPNISVGTSSPGQDVNTICAETTVAIPVAKTVHNQTSVAVSRVTTVTDPSSAKMSRVDTVNYHNSSAVSHFKTVHDQNVLPIPRVNTINAETSSTIDCFSTDISLTVPRVRVTNTTDSLKMPSNATDMSSTIPPMDTTSATNSLRLPRVKTTCAKVSAELPHVNTASAESCSSNLTCVHMVRAETSSPVLSVNTAITETPPPVPNVATATGKPSSPMLSINAVTFTISSSKPGDNTIISKPFLPIPSVSTVNSQPLSPIIGINTVIGKISSPMPSENTVISKISSPMPSVKSVISKRSSLTDNVNTAINKVSSPMPSVKSVISKRSSLTDIVNTAINNVSSPMPSVNTLIRETSSQMPGVKIGIPVSGTGISVYSSYTQSRNTSTTFRPASTASLSMPRVSTNTSLSSSKERQRREEMRLTSTMLLVVMVYVISWMPYCVAILVNVFRQDPLPSAVDMITLLMGYGNSLYNPFIYGWKNASIRCGYLKLWQDVREMVGDLRSRRRVKETANIVFEL